VKELQYYDIEEFRRATNRKMWAVIGVSAFTSFIALLIALLAVSKPTPVIAYDSQGRPVVFEDSVTPRVQMDEIRVEAYMRSFSELWVGIDSDTVAKDFKKAVGLMTPRLRDIVVTEGAELKTRSGYLGQDVGTVFQDVQVKIADYDIEDTSADVHGVVWGKAVFKQKLAQGSEIMPKYFVMKTKLERVPLTVKNPWGLEVDFVETKLFDNEDALRVFVNK